MKIPTLTTKAFKIALLAIITIFSVLSCRKDDEPTVKTYQEENPLQSYLTTAGLSVNKDYVNENSNFEFGIEFTPLVKGKINALVVNIPDTNPTLKVTIWDATTKSILRTELINVTSSNVNVTKDITPVNLEKDKKYAITFNSNDWHYRTKNDASNITYPITAGNIRIEKYGFAGGIIQVYPTNYPVNYYAGDLSFKFQQID